MHHDSCALSLHIEFVKKNNGAWLVNHTKPSNFDKLTIDQKNSLDNRLNKMISSKYRFINYNGLRKNTLMGYETESVKNGGRRNIFDNKVVIIDEADYLNPTSTQPALRGFIEKFSDNCSFIFTCNYKNRIIDPIHSRTSVIDFRIDKKQQPKIASKLLKRILSILDENEVQYEEKVIAEVILKYFPDFRRILNELQRYSQHGIIDTGIFQSFSDSNFRKLIHALKDKKFSEIRKWVVDNSDNDPKLIYRKLYDNLQDYLEPTSIPPAILLLADYQHKAAFVADQEINLTACLIEMMVDCAWR